MIPMQKSKIISFEAEKRWKRIPKDLQKRILENVWCCNCADSTAILIESSEMVQNDLILRGKCKTCGHEVCRLVEAEE